MCEYIICYNENVHLYIYKRNILHSDVKYNASDLAEKVATGYILAFAMSRCRPYTFVVSLIPVTCNNVKAIKIRPKASFLFLLLGISIICQHDHRLQLLLKGFYQLEDVQKNNYRWRAENFIFYYMFLIIEQCLK